MTRRGLFAPLLGAVAAGCAPLVGGREALWRPPEPRRIDGFRYGDDPRQRVELWTPATRPTAARPVVVLLGDGRSDDDVDGRELAARGFLVAVADYRRGADGRAPAAIADAAAAAALVADLCASHGGDPDRLAVIGRGGAAPAVLMIALDRRYMAAVEAPETIRAAAALDGPFAFPAFGPGPDRTLTQPRGYVRGDAPPLWLAPKADAAAEADDLRLRVRAAGGRCETAPYGEPVLTELCAFLDRTLS